MGCFPFGCVRRDCRGGRNHLDGTGSKVVLFFIEKKLPFSMVVVSGFIGGDRLGGKRGSR